MNDKGRLIFLCGKMGAGKSTKSKEIALQRNAVLLSEDDWLSSIYPNQISCFEDYLKFSAQLKPLVRSHVQNILSTGTNVVMDFPANTVRQRLWFKELALEINAFHELIYIKRSDKTCLQQIAQRRIQLPERAAFDTEEVFYEVTKFFEEPGTGEDLQVKQI